MAVPLAWLCRGVHIPGFLGLALVVTALGIVAAHAADRVWGTHDSGRIVVDEVAGFLFTVSLVDRADPWALGVGFVVFRFFDIVKPPPVRWLDENLPGGWGVVLDDVAAGVLGMATMVAIDAAGGFDALGRIW